MAGGSNHRAAVDGARAPAGAVEHYKSPDHVSGGHASFRSSACGGRRNVRNTGGTVNHYLLYWYNQNSSTRLSVSGLTESILAIHDLLMADPGVNSDLVTIQAKYGVLVAVKVLRNERH